MSKFQKFTSKDDQEAVAHEWMMYGIRLAVSTMVHPFEYAKALMQMGHEPLAPRPGRTIFGKHTLILPNVFQYVGHIKRTDGFVGCFRGCGPKIVGNVISSFGSEKLAERLGLGYIENPKDDEELTDEEQLTRFQMQLKRDVVIHVSSVVISHPFHVVTIRMMAEFVGREGRYTGLFASIGEIWREDGVLGFFSGLVPRLLCDVSCLVLVSTSAYYVNKHYIKDKDSRQYFTSFSQFIFSSILYPLQVVSTCMIVSGSGLQAGKPPNMPTFTGWLDCWNHLSATNCLKRGSSLFFRYYRPYNPIMGKTVFSSVPMPKMK